MTINIHALPGSQAFFVHCSDVITLEGMIDKLTEFVIRPAKVSPTPIIVDLTPVVDIDLSLREIQRFIPYLRVALSDPRNQFHFHVAAPSVRTRALAMMFQLLTRGEKRLGFRVYRSVAEAFEDAGLQPAAAQDFARKVGR